MRQSGLPDEGTRPGCEGRALDEARAEDKTRYQQRKERVEFLEANALRVVKALLITGAILALVVGIEGYLPGDQRLSGAFMALFLAGQLQEFVNARGGLAGIRPPRVLRRRYERWKSHFLGITEADWPDPEPVRPANNRRARSRRRQK